MPKVEHDPQHVEPVDRTDEPVLVEILAPLAPLLHAEVREQPAHVRVDETPDGAKGAGAVADVRRVRVSLLVRHRVMLAVVGDPLRDRALHRHAAEDRERRPNGRAGLEALVREQAVKADGRAERAEDVEPDQQSEVVPVERDPPEQAHRRQQPERRQNDRDERHDLADAAGAERSR